MTPHDCARALIAEDEPLLAAALQADLAREWPQLEIVATVGSGDAAVARALASRPDVCFLDIRMPGRSGLEAAEALVEDWPDGVPFPLLVFVTAYEAHALQAFEHAAVDYLVKPVAPERLARCVQRLQGLLARRGDAAPALQRAVDSLRALLAPGAAPAAAPPPPRLELIQAQHGTLIHMVPVDDVIYLEAADKVVRVVTADRELLVRTSLRELMTQLDPQRFWQVHRGTVVQARCIATARRDEAGKVHLTLRGRAETLVASRLHAHLFRGM